MRLSSQLLSQSFWRCDKGLCDFELFVEGKVIVELKARSMCRVIAMSSESNGPSSIDGDVYMEQPSLRVVTMPYRAQCN